ncbi:hypothetical protein PAXRUDRAFT_821301 [Paxillus rubicundulus Ve08.2h10]|uniref:Uncharacterized protein n=1 Tax=Paxillus rubicundulus Ve08.2h10 TaxID=930991 RepID=A0A0D0DP86_9AGAM|nr:hypothetical protein PAXRUDRAFT_821301 [Paxillus rubicundulus Ve08.2h10]
MFQLGTGSPCVLLIVAVFQLVSNARFKASATTGQRLSVANITCAAKHLSISVQA